MTIPASWKKNVAHQKELQEFLETPAGAAFKMILLRACVMPRFPATTSVEGLIEATAMRSERISGHTDVLALVESLTFDEIRAAEKKRREQERAQKKPRTLADLKKADAPEPEYAPSLIH